LEINKGTQKQLVTGPITVSKAKTWVFAGMVIHNCQGRQFDPAPRYQASPHFSKLRPDPRDPQNLNE
jgi:hypothetical protein